ncbi:GNAT family N-acetyltransferase [Propionimicrobium sp. PCR01-08-3]|uniref:GNAT family N-acetyltransferase n=1 Tax=Propionimicrobium sp. PCR01-08-3 TaxID=3052086 RepID=UPI00255D04D2|nr:GNAT family N-acetyltransferase [Propionimicrobium sp. PCR01-08-3]WIY81586.1 DUF4081 domain-containing protein [Propionimicrobium sp. PCR01-08-3]
MSGSIRVLDDEDLPEFLSLLACDPLSNLFVASRVSTFGLAPQSLGCAVYGYYAGGELVAACHVGSNLVPIGASTEAMEAFADAIGPRRQVASMVGKAAAISHLHARLCDRWGTSWKYPREVRAHQPLMVIRRSPLIPGDARIRRVDTTHAEAYTKAAVAMYTEEVGVSPVDSSGSYSRYVRVLMQMGRAMGGIVPADEVRHPQERVWFKSDIGSAWRQYCQVQGVWLDPVLRGRRMSVPAMAQVVNLCQQQFSEVSLYVNDFNTPARRLYSEIGFVTVDELATVLY